MIMSAVTCVQTIPFIPKKWFSKNRNGIFNTICRIKASQKDSFPRPIACIKCTMWKLRNINGVAKHLACRKAVPYRTVSVSEIKILRICGAKTRYKTTQQTDTTRPASRAAEKNAFILLKFPAE